ncbi:MAG: hypothetical protein RMK18_10775 [Armatimonadota bacterium]|nr:hypothetical protein [Armatimonadota bacterium]MDW8026329.1 hypothetical protein [Armatimonadota bacterium]
MAQEGNTLGGQANSDGSNTGLNSGEAQESVTPQTAQVQQPSHVRVFAIIGWLIALLSLVLNGLLVTRLRITANEVKRLSGQISHHRSELAHAAWQLLSPARRDLTYASFSFDPELYTPHQVIEYLESARPWINLAREIVPEPKHAEQLSKAVALLDEVKELLSQLGQQESAQQKLNEARDILRDVMGQLQRMRTQ